MESEKVSEFQLQNDILFYYFYNVTIQSRNIFGRMYFWT